MAQRGSSNQLAGGVLTLPTKMRRLAHAPDRVYSQMAVLAQSVALPTCSTCPAAPDPALPPLPFYAQTFIDAPNAASGPIPDDVSPFFEGPYFEW